MEISNLFIGKHIIFDTVFFCFSFTPAEIFYLDRFNLIEIYPNSKLFWKEELNTKYLTRKSAKEITQKYRQKVVDFKQS